ncbi:MAG: response regulator, partial [bacterium]|nr:response regulator [bacterium]
MPVLIIDDQPAVREALQVLFEIHDLPCRTASTAEEALGIVRREPIGVAIQDMNFERGRTSGDEGVALFRRLKAIDPDLPVLLITAWTSLETAVQLVKEGASDYLAKPWDDRALVDNVE